MIKKIAIVGGGFAGWYTAISLQHNLPDVELVVIDSAKHPTIGVGETVGWDAPLNFERLCGLKDDREFMYETGAIYKFGVRGFDFFRDDSLFVWSKFQNLKASSLCKFYNEFDYPDFSEPWNRDSNDIGTIDAWIRMYHGQKNYHDFCQEIGEVTHFITNPVAPYDDRGNYILRQAKGQSWGYHLDAEKTWEFLKKQTKARNTGNLTHITSTVTDVAVNTDGAITHLKLENGSAISADLYIDASGLQRVLMRNSHNPSWQDSSDQYCNSAWVCQTAYSDVNQELLGATEWHGEDWGWRFKIRLYHRVGNGYVFNSRMVDPEIPLTRLKSVTEGSRLFDPKLITWSPGEFRAPWHQNLLPMGLAQGFIDPYDAVSFDSHSRALEDLLHLLRQPELDLNCMIQQYNERRFLTMEERRMRLDVSFGISQRTGPFWDSRRAMGLERGVFEKIKDVILERRSDLESRLTWHWHHQYIRSALAAGVDMSDWQFPPVPEKDQEMFRAFFEYNRQRNRHIARQSWPNYAQWLQHNRFNGESTNDVLKRINPALAQKIS